MRKLSKKISMLMVLAMLVSLFSGVVSASAASIWSFYNRETKEVVAKGGIYEMEKNEYANFDLWREGKDVSEAADKFTVVWSSSDKDVVYVDATNGRLRADKYGVAEAGDKAVISATFTNERTKITATRSFTIVIADDADYAIVADFADEVFAVGEKYELAATVTADGEAVEAKVAFTLDGAAITEFAPAEAGEYTIVATATIDGEVVATEEFVVVAEENAPEIVAAKQTKLDTVEITFNSADWAKSFADKVLFSYFAGDVEIADIVKKVEAKDAVATVTLYSALTAETVYKFAYEGYDCEKTITAVKSEPAYITLAGGKIPQTDSSVEAKIFTADDVDITTDELLANVTYKSLNDDICDVNSINGDVFFYEVGKTAAIEATYEMGWNDDGEENTDLTTKAAYTSVNPYEYSKPNGYAVAADGKSADDIKKLTYGSRVELALDDEYEIYAKYLETKYDGETKDKYITNGAPEDIAVLGAYTFYSTNESIVFVSTDGVLYPCATGTASVYLKDSDDKVVGSVAVTVKAARKLNSFTGRIDDKMLSTAIADKTSVAVSAKDQHGADYAVNYSIELISPTTGANGQALTAADFFSNTNALANVDGKVELVLDQAKANAAIATGTVKTVSFKLKAADVNDAQNVKEQRLNVSIKNMVDVDAANTDLKVSATTVDTKLDKANASSYEVTIKLEDICKDKYALGNHALGFAADASKAADVYTVVISKGDTKYTAGTHFAYADNVVTIKPVVVSGNEIIKMEAGTYKVQLFKGVNGTAAARPIDVTSVVITDSTPAITVEVKADTLASNDEAGVEGALKFIRNGAEISNTDEKDYIDVIDVVDPVNAIAGKVYVKTIKVKVNPKEMKGDNTFAAGDYFVETITVNQLFKY